MAMAIVPQTFHYVNNLVPGRTNWRMRVRVIRLWMMPDSKTKQEVGSVDMIIVDEKFAKIQATIPRQWLPKFFGVIREGEAYVLENLMIGKNDLLHPKTEHKLKVNFLGSTKVTNVIVDHIPVHVFDFLDFPNILSTKKTDIHIDVIGHVVEKNNMREKVVHGRNTQLLDLVLEDLSQHRVKCALWGDFAEQMLYQLQRANPAAPVVVVLQLCRLGSYQGVGNISSAWHETKLYINEDIPAIHDYTSRMVNEEGLSLTPTVTQMTLNPGSSIGEEILSTRRMSISDLIESTQPGLGSVLVEAVEFDMSEGWAFNSCNTCFRTAVKLKTGFTCKHCETFVSATPRYKLNVVVIDDTGSTTFTLFNGLVAMIVGRSAVDLMKSYSQRGTVAEQSIEFEPMLGKKYLFKVEVTKGNIEKGYSTYTAKKFSDDPAVIQKFIINHGINVNMLYLAKDDHTMVAI